MHLAVVMGRVRRTKDGVDAVEHALRGVHTSENHERIVSFDRNPGFVGTHSIVQIDVVDDSPLEHEVVVRLPRNTRDRKR
jgi:hypothetical protein